MSHHLAPERARANVRSFLAGLGRPSERDRSPAEILKRLLQRAPDPGAALGWLVAHDEDRRLREHAVMLLYTAAKDPNVPRSIRRPILKSAGPVLTRAFQDPNVDDEMKFMVGPALSLCGIEIPDETYARAFRDHEGICRRMALEAFRSRPATPESVDAWLEKIELPDQAAFSRAVDMASTAVEANAPFGASLLVTLAAIGHERGFRVESSRTLDAAAATRTGEARWMLRIAGELPAMGAVGDQARRLVIELEGAGVEEACPEAGTVERGILSLIDGVGSRHLAVLFRCRGSKNRDCLNLMLNDETGIKATYCVYEDGAEVFRVFREHPDISVAPCDMALARALVADALAIHEREGMPVPGRFLLLRHFLGREPLRPAFREPDLSAYRLEGVKIGPALVARSRTLAHRPDCRFFYCASDRAYEFVRRRLTSDAEDDRLLVLDGREMEKFIRDIALEERPRLLQRLAKNLEVEALAGRAGRADNKRLARLWLGLQHDVVPFAEVPFVVELTRNGIGAILENVLQGYNSQAEVNAAELAANGDEDEDEIPY